MENKELTKVVDCLKERVGLLEENGLEISVKRNETELDSIEVGNSKTGKFKMYFNLAEISENELSEKLETMVDATKKSNESMGSDFK